MDEQVIDFWDGYEALQAAEDDNQYGQEYDHEEV